MPLPVKEAKSRELLRDKIFRAVRDEIVDGHLKPGEQLVEAELAKDLNVSRAALRESFWGLERHGFVTIVPRRGTFVVNFSWEAMNEVFELREVLEPLAAKRAHRNLRVQDKEELRRFASLMRQSVDTGDWKTYFENDLCFHQKIWSLSGSRRLQESLQVSCIGLFTFFIINSGNLSKSLGIEWVQTHEQILNAFEEKSADNVESLIRQAVREMAQIARKRFHALRH